MHKKKTFELAHSRMVFLLRSLSKTTNLQNVLNKKLREEVEVS